LAYSPKRTSAVVDVHAHALTWVSAEFRHQARILTWVSAVFGKNSPITLNLSASGSPQHVQRFYKNPRSQELRVQCFQEVPRPSRPPVQSFYKNPKTQEQGLQCCQEVPRPSHQPAQSFLQELMHLNRPSAVLSTIASMSHPSSAEIPTCPPAPKHGYKQVYDRTTKTWSFVKKTTQD